MRATTGLLAFAATLSSASAAFQGFNYGSTFTTGAAKQESDFEAEFKNAQNLVGAPGGGFTSARLYTMIQAGTAQDPISAIQAAINTKTSLLLGLWASAGQAAISNEIAALKTAISQHGTAFTSLVAGISIGSEDLYRITPTSLANGDTNPGAQPLELAGYIKQVRDAIANTPLSSAPLGHVDTWTAWVNGSNQAVIDACDFIGVDAYPYFQNTMPNDISQNKGLFDDAAGAVQAAVGGKPVWITETGYPVSGKTVGQAVPSLANAKTYWDEVGCPMFGKTNVWWYTMQDASPDTPNPSFGLIGQDLTTKPLFDLSCNNVAASSSSSSSASASKTGSSGPSISASVSTSGGSGTTSVNVPTSLAGGSPGVGTGLPGSQSSLEAGPTGTGSNAAPTGTGGGSVGGGSGSNSTGTFGSPTPTVSPSASHVPGSGAAALSGSVAAGFLALMGAILIL